MTENKEQPPKRGRPAGSAYSPSNPTFFTGDLAEKERHDFADRLVEGDLQIDLSGDYVTAVRSLYDQIRSGPSVEAMVTEIERESRRPGWAGIISGALLAGDDINEAGEVTHNGEESTKFFLKQFRVQAAQSERKSLRDKAAAKAASTASDAAKLAEMEAQRSASSAGTNAGGKHR